MDPARLLLIRICLSRRGSFFFPFSLTLSVFLSLSLSHSSLSLPPSKEIVHRWSGSWLCWLQMFRGLFPQSTLSSAHCSKMAEPFQVVHTMSTMFHFFRSTCFSCSLKVLAKTSVWKSLICSLFVRNPKQFNLNDLHCADSTVRLPVFGSRHLVRGLTEPNLAG